MLLKTETLPIKQLKRKKKKNRKQQVASHSPPGVHMEKQWKSSGNNRHSNTI